MGELEALRANWMVTICGDGGKCPVCDRFGKRYARSLNETMARSLIWLVHAHEKSIEGGVPGGWVVVPTRAPRWLVRSNQLPTLRWWGLVERHEEELDGQLAKHNGLWRPTPKGINFRDNKITVPRKAVTYNGEVESFTGGEISINECFGSVFEYLTMMSDPGREE